MTAHTFKETVDMAPVNRNLRLWCKSWIGHPCAHMHLVSEAVIL
jgi:hypothetical protein